MLSVEIYKKLKQRPSPAIVADEFILDVKFEARSGVTILFGASGSGKSMTLKAIAGIVRPERGRIVMPNHVLFDSGQAIDLPIRERHAGYVFQNLALFPHLTALQNVEFAMPQLARRARRERALAALKSFGIEHTAGRRPRAISGGEAQRVALARVLASEPQFLLLDEPLSALDESTTLTLINDLKNLNRQLQLPVLYVTHSREEALTLGERVIVYERGRVVAEGQPLEVFRTAASLSIARLTGVENVFDGWVVRQNEAAGTLTIEIMGASSDVCRIEVPYGQQAMSERVRIAVRAGDILLATQEPRFTSARNILRGRITSIEEKGDRIHLCVISGTTWVVSVTRQSAIDLQLIVGTEVWLAIKTFSCYVLDQ